MGNDLVVSSVLTSSCRCFAAGGAALTYISGFHRPFSLTDPAISYPLKANIVSLPVVAIISLIGPAAVIAIVNLGVLGLGRFKPTKTSINSHDKMLGLIWETHVGWLGLCAGLASTLFITAGLKDIIGKPRPDMLARCNPDLANIADYVVGGFGMNLDSESPPFVTSAICKQLDKHLLDDGFASFPSGHASFNSAGMVYLTLWLCARWGIGIRLSKLNPTKVTSAPPLWQTAIALIPILVMLFVSSSRYADFHHAGFDIIAGMILGSVLGWVSFRFYHSSVRRASGLVAWVPRDANHAFFSYNQRIIGNDEEQGRRSLGTELDSLDTSPPARTATDSSQREILENPSRRL